MTFVRDVCHAAGWSEAVKLAHLTRTNIGDHRSPPDLRKCGKRPKPPPAFSVHPRMAGREVCLEIPLPPSGNSVAVKNRRIMEPPQTTGARTSKRHVWRRR